MTLCFDVGNTRIKAGLFNEEGRVIKSFSLSLDKENSSEQISFHIAETLQGAGLSLGDVTKSAYCSVVPSFNQALEMACEGSLGSRAFCLTGLNATGLTKLVAEPSRVGADRIAAALGGMNRYPRENLIIADMGTATTVDAVSAEGEFLGGTILPGLAMSRDSLVSGTAQLPPIEIIQAPRSCGRDTVEAIQAGLYYGALGAVREISQRFTEECFSGLPVRIVATGGFSILFEGAPLFDSLHPHLVLEGVHSALIHSS